MVIRANAFSFFQETLNHAVAILIISALVLLMITLHGVVIARYDVILDQSVRMLLYNQLSNYTHNLYSILPVDFSDLIYMLSTWKIICNRKI